jgi:hypothetical protein
MSDINHSNVDDVKFHNKFFTNDDQFIDLSQVPNVEFNKIQNSSLHEFQDKIEFQDIKGEIEEREARKGRFPWSCLVDCNLVSKRYQNVSLFQSAKARISKRKICRSLKRKKRKKERKKERKK